MHIVIVTLDSLLLQDNTINDILTVDYNAAILNLVKTCKLDIRLACLQDVCLLLFLEISCRVTK